MKPPDQGDNTCFSLKHPCCGTLCKQPAQIKANTISPCHSFDKCVAELLRIWAFRNAWRWLLWLGRQLQTDLVLFFFLSLFCFVFSFLPRLICCTRANIFYLFFIRYPSDLNSAFGIWLALNKNLLPERLNPLLRVEESNHYFFLSRWLFNHITEVGQGTTY